MESHYFQVHDSNYHVQISTEAWHHIIRNDGKLGDLVDGRPVIILVHGLVVASPYFEGLANQLAVHFPVLVPDLPGFGLTAHAEILTIPELADALERLMSHLGIEKACLVGNSMGCQIITRFAKQHPNRISHAVLQGPTVEEHKRTYLQQVKGFINNGLYEPPGMTLIMMRDYARAGFRRFFWTLTNALELSILDDLPHMTMPTLVIVGELDKMTPVEWSKRVASLIPNCKYVQLPSVAHTAIYSHPETLSFFITPFLFDKPLPTSFYYTTNDKSEYNNSLCSFPNVADFDSASGMVRALSHYTHGRDYRALGVSTYFPALSESLGALVNYLPNYLKDTVYEWGGWNESIKINTLDNLNTDSVADIIVNGFPRMKFSAIAIGSSNGAITHLCAAMKMPWLPQTFLVPVTRNRNLNPNLDFTVEMKWGARAARRFLDENPQIQLHQMLDPNQDARMSQHMAYFRCKWIVLPDAYKQFITDNLEDGGTIIITEDSQSWPCTKAGERHYFQCGAYGGLTPSEYINGSERVKKFIHEHQSKRINNWNAPQPDCEVPEAEWGFVQSLREDIEQFAKERNYRVKRLQYHQPHTVAPLVADVYREWYKSINRPTDQLLVSSFMVMDPYCCLRTSSIPYWTVFAVKDEADRLNNYVKTVTTSDRAFKNIYVMLMSHGVQSIGVSRIKDWEDTMKLATHCGLFIGVDKRTFPKDFASTMQYHVDLKKLPQSFLPRDLSLQQFEEIVTTKLQGANEVLYF